MPYLEKVNREELLTAVCIVFSLDKKKIKQTLGR